MGYLHEGHCSLIRKAKKENATVVATIFVNPSQFAPHEDLDKYPRDIPRDTELAKSAGADLLFIPKTTDIYPDGFSTHVIVDGLSSVLEGKFRPTHFKGVTTVVLKLFNIVQPAAAYFGQKDVQQSIIIRKMVKDLNIPIRIEIVPTVREEDGLAMSSRNVYLTPEQRKNAIILHQSLVLAETMINKGERNTGTVISAMKDLIIAKNPTQIDYVEIVDSEDLTPKEILRSGERIVVPLAVRFGTTRLIDNMIMTIQ